ncbi:hypothetical protein PMAYCL1PPCAC_30955, partial [Pristionchus mayeri]
SSIFPFLLESITDQHFEIELDKTMDGRTSKITSFITALFILFYSIPLVLFCSQATREISEEAASNMKDYLLSMGMSRVLYFLHHFIYTFIKAWISVIGCSIIFGFVFNCV